MNWVAVWHTFLLLAIGFFVGNIWQLYRMRPTLKHWRKGIDEVERMMINTSTLHDKLNEQMDDLLLLRDQYPDIEEMTEPDPDAEKGRSHH